MKYATARDALEEHRCLMLNGRPSSYSPTFDAFKDLMKTWSNDATPLIAGKSYLDMTSDELLLVIYIGRPAFNDGLYFKPTTEAV